jgi:type 1 glutamine amidotransferase
VTACPGDTPRRPHRRLGVQPLTFSLLGSHGKPRYVLGMRCFLAVIACLAGACHAADRGMPADAADAIDAPPHIPAVIDARCEGAAGKPRVLVFSRENLWNHPSNPIAAQALLDMCGTRGYTVTTSHDPSVFFEQLPTSDVVVFAVTSGPVLSAEAQGVFEPWVRAGGGVIGLHSASATDLEWPFFVDLMGGQFRGHGPGLFDATLKIVDATHPTTAGIGAPTLTRTDEWYTFVQHPEAIGMTVLMTLDESTLPADYPAELLMGYHAMTWVHERFGGRVFYTGLGHMPDTYAQPWFLDMLGRAIDWTAAGHPR